MFGAGQMFLTHESGHNLGLWHTHHGVFEVDTPTYGDYSCDMDHSNACGPADILRLIDLLNGSSKFVSLNN